MFAFPAFAFLFLPLGHADVVPGCTTALIICLLVILNLRGAWISSFDSFIFYTTESETLQPSKVCGRGKTAFNSFGNRRLRILVGNSLKKYRQAEQRNKVQIVLSIVRQIKEASPFGGFIKKDNDGRWWTVCDEDAYSKVSHLFRDCLASPTNQPTNQAAETCYQYEGKADT